MYFIVVPQMIQNAFENYDTNKMQYNDLSVISATNTTIHARIDATDSTNYGFLGTIKVEGPVVASVYRDDKPDSLMTRLTVQDSMVLSGTSANNFKSDILLEINDMASFQGAMACDVCTDSKGLSITVNVPITLTITGVRWYTGLPISIHKTLTKPKGNSSSIGFKVPQGLKQPNLNSKIKSKYNESTLMSFGDGMPAIHVNSFDISNLSGASMTINTQIEMENFVRLSANLSSISVALGFSGSDFLRINILPLNTQTIQLKSDGINSLSMAIQIVFLQNAGLSFLTPLIIITELATRKDVTLDGPIDIVIAEGQGDLIGALTRNFRAPVDLSKAGGGIDKLKNLFGPDTLSHAFDGIGNNIMNGINNIFGGGNGGGSRPNSIMDGIRNIFDGK